MLSVGMIVGGAFRLIRERPGSVLMWGAVYSLAAFAIGYFMVSSMAPMMAMGERSDPNVALTAMRGFFARMLLVYLVFFFVYTILMTAAQRAVLRPGESDFASIRLGGDELRMIGLALFLGFLFMIGYLVAFMILGVVAVAVGSGNPVAAMPVMIIGGLVILCLLLFFWVRVSLAFPLTLMRRRFVLGEAWQLSRGHFWTLLGGYAVLTVILIAVALVASLVLQGSYWSQLMGGGLTGPGAQRAAQAQMEAQYALGLPMILSLLLGTVMGGLTFAFTGGGTATAARALAVDHEGIAETFT
jgi:hypothetical protein